MATKLCCSLVGHDIGDLVVYYERVTFFWYGLLTYTMRMEAECTSEMAVTTYITQLSNPEDQIQNFKGRENFYV
jgi:hypothetical protein